MRTITGIALMMLLAGCATGGPHPDAWVSDGRGGYCYQQDATCSYTGEAKFNDSGKWWKLVGDVFDAANQGADAVRLIR
jgi:hypothetical protein